MSVLALSWWQITEESTMQAHSAALSAAAPHPGRALTALALSTLLAALGTSSANVALPSLQQAFGAPFPMVQWVVLAYLLAITALVVSAKQTGRPGRAQGAAAGRTGPVFPGLGPVRGGAHAGLADRRPGAAGNGGGRHDGDDHGARGRERGEGESGQRHGLAGDHVGRGHGTRPVAGGALVARYGWEAIFLLNFPLGIITLLLCHRFLPAERPRGPSGRTGIDHPGTILLAITLASYALAMTTRHFLLLGMAAAVLVLFVLWERRAPAPLIPLVLFRDRVYMYRLRHQRAGHDSGHGDTGGRGRSTSRQAWG
ncbi:hypothetical protein LP420_40905 [Massilia sp. B-10]|nr:hypothetical protein LP420_40905 [Massilia sp. B-10]